MKPLLLLDIDGVLNVALARARSRAPRNALAGAALGLPPLPTVTFAGPHAATGPDWTFPAVGRFAYGRALVWFDDDFGLRPGAKERFLRRGTRRRRSSPSG